MCFAALNNHTGLIEYLCENKGRVNQKDKYGRSPLILAVQQGHTQTASLLLQRGCDIEHADNSGNRALHFAAAFGWFDIV